MVTTVVTASKVAQYRATLLAFHAHQSFSYSNN
jgi:hypothetical protein